MNEFLTKLADLMEEYDSEIEVDWGHDGVEGMNIHSDTDHVEIGYCFDADDIRSHIDVDYKPQEPESEWEHRADVEALKAHIEVLKQTVASYGEMLSSCRRIAGDAIKNLAMKNK